MKQSLFRKLTYKKLSEIKIDGKIIDLGGIKNADYHTFLGEKSSITVVNSDKNTNPDVLHNLENALVSIADNCYDGALMINLLEHIYNYNIPISESNRILKRGGKLIAVIPFVYYIHSSPNDYFRYSKQSIEKILEDNDFSEIQIEEIGYGAFSAAYNLIHRFFPLFTNLIFERVAIGLDIFVKFISKKSGKKYSGEEYPIGYFVKAVKK